MRHRTGIICALLLALLASPVAAVTGTPTSSALVTVSTTAIGITCPGTTVGALVEVLTNNINYSFVGGTPDTTSHYMAAGGIIALGPGVPATLTMVRNGGSDATVRYTCFRS